MKFIKKAKKAFLLGLSLASLLYFSSCPPEKKQKPRIGSLEGKVTTIAPSPAPPSFYNAFATIQEAPNTKVCLTEKQRDFDGACTAKTFTDSEGNYTISTYAGSYNECFDINNDENYDECDTVIVEPNKTISDGKKEVECKDKKPFNCFTGLDKQNYCPGEVMNISIKCTGSAGFPYSLTGVFVNEKDNVNIYDIISIANAEGDFSSSVLYPLPLTWPKTNTPPGADWKFYLWSNSNSNGVFKEDKDNFNILDNICNTPPGQLGLEVIVENGNNNINYTNNVNATFIPSDQADELAHCVSEEETCTPSSYSPFNANRIVNLPGASGLKHVCGKAKKNGIIPLISNTSCDDIFVDLLLPYINFTRKEQTNLDSGSSLNDIYAEACISDNTGVKKVIGKVYDSGNNLIKQQELGFAEDASCARPGEIGYKVNINVNNVNNDTFTIELIATDLATNENSGEAQQDVDLIGPIANVSSLDHLLTNYTCYSNQSKNEEQCSNVSASEFRYDATYPEFYTNQVGLDGRHYNGLLDIDLSGTDQSGIALYEIDWVDGNIETTGLSSKSHGYANSGYYTVKVRAKDNKENWGNQVQMPVKIAMHQKDADRGFWQNVYSSIPGLTGRMFAAYNCDIANEVGQNDWCWLSNNNLRIINLGSNAYYLADFYQTTAQVGHVYVSLDKLVSNGTPVSDLRLSNSEIIYGNNQANIGYPWAAAIVPVTYDELVSTTTCTDPSQKYKSLYCWYKQADDRGDF